MSLMALVGPDKAIDRFDRNIDPSAGTKKGYYWLPAEDIIPHFDPATQERSGPEIIVEDTRVVRRWTVTDKSAEQLAQEAEDAKERETNALGRLALRVLLNHENRMRKLEGRAEVTPAQFREAIKKMLDAGS